MHAQKLGVCVVVATLVVTLSCLLTTVTAAGGDQPVYFSLMVSRAPTLDTSGIVSAVDRALELINNDPKILSGYDLQYSQVLDTQVRLSLLLASVVYSFLWYSQLNIMVCSVTTATARNRAYECDRSV